MVRWEHQRLSMQKEDLEEKWREIQQTKLSKENQRSLGESSQVRLGGTLRLVQSTTPAGEQQSGVFCSGQGK